MASSAFSRCFPATQFVSLRHPAASSVQVLASQAIVRHQIPDQPRISWGCFNGTSRSKFVSKFLEVAGYYRYIGLLSLVWPSSAFVLECDLVATIFSSYCRFSFDLSGARVVP